MTFDDGPSANTPDLLATLANHNVKASFFMIGSNVQSYPQNVKAAYDAGHHIACHTQTHPSLPSLSLSGQIAELTGCSNAIHAAIGKTPTYFRPPYGDYDANTIAAAKSLNLKMALWDSDTQDLTKSLSTDQIIQAYHTILGGTSPSTNSAIFLEHEIWANTRAAVDTLINYVNGLGYKLVTMPECLGDGVSLDLFNFHILSRCFALILQYENVDFFFFFFYCFCDFPT